MKKLLLISGISIICCFRALCQQDAGESLNAGNFSDEISHMSINSTNPAFPRPVATFGAYSITDNKISNKSGWYAGLDANNDTLFAIAYKRKKLMGNWLGRYSKHQICDSGRLENNIPDGVWKSWYRNGKLRSIRTYSAAKLQALKNDLIRYNYKNNMNRIAAMEKKQRGMYRYHTSAYQSLKTFLYADIINRDQELSLLEKMSINASSSNGHYLPPFHECYHDGLFMNFYSSGETRDSGYYKNGLREGLWIEKMHDGEIISRGAYCNGLKKGIWSFFNRNGKLAGLKTYGARGEETHCKWYGN